MPQRRARTRGPNAAAIVVIGLLGSAAGLAALGSHRAHRSGGPASDPEVGLAAGEPSSGAPASKLSHRVGGSRSSADQLSRALSLLSSAAAARTPPGAGAPLAGPETASDP